MCGICGVAFTDPARVIDRRTLERMRDTMRRRGPDSHGAYSAPGIGLGVRRLSIIDLETGDQPMSNEDGTVTIVCNGEIYNFVELREELLARGHRFATRSDVEVIAHLYEESGAECVHRLRGMFAFALWDSRRRVLMLARDRLGIKPLCYAVAPEGLWFASEVKPILIGGPFTAELDVCGMKDLFLFGFVLGARTLFSGLRRLQPGQYLLCRDGRTSLHTYWRVSFPPRAHPSAEMSAEEWAEALLEKLKQSVRLHLRSDVPVGAWLSGGIDSSTIVALIHRTAGVPVKTFSLAFENPLYDEVARNRMLTSFDGFALSNHEVVCGAKDFKLFPKAVWHCENVSTTGLEIPHMILSEATAQHVKVVLTGEGSDEVLGGYSWFWRDKLLRPLSGLPLGLRRLMLLGPLLPRLFPHASRAVLAPGEMTLARYQMLISRREPKLPDRLFSQDLRRRIAGAEPTEAAQDAPADFHRWHPFTQLQYFDLTVRLPNFIVNHLDHISMAHSLEGRVPFLDHELVEFCAGIPPALKMKGLREKHVLRQAVRDVLPAEIVRRRKRGLAAPYTEWLRKKLPDFAAEMLSEGCLRGKGYFDAQAVLDLLERHRKSGSRTLAPTLFTVLTVQLWDELFVRRQVADGPP